MINWDRVTELQSEIGEEDFAEVGQIFVEEIEEKLDQLAAPGATIDAADFHFLRGSAANLGLDAFASACTTAEDHARAGTAVDIAALRALFGQSLAELEGLFDAA